MDQRVDTSIQRELEQKVANVAVSPMILPMFVSLILHVVVFAATIYAIQSTLTPTTAEHSTVINVRIVTATESHSNIAETEQSAVQAAMQAAMQAAVQADDYVTPELMDRVPEVIATINPPKPKTAPLAEIVPETLAIVKTEEPGAVQPEISATEDEQRKAKTGDAILTADASTDIKKEQPGKASKDSGVNVETGTSKPTEVRGNPKPKYPRLARQKGYEGYVELLVTVLRDGNIQDVSIQNSSGYAILDKAAAKTIRMWKFQPAIENGIAIDSATSIPVTFQLTDPIR